MPCPFERLDDNIRTNERDCWSSYFSMYVACTNVIFFQLELERSTQQTNKEEHNKRLKNLRKTVEHLLKTEWKFTSIDKLIGQ